MFSNLTDIMPPMFSPQSRFNRVVAISLGCCFGWIFFACTWLCTHHSDQECEGRVDHHTKTFAIFGDSDHCPIEQARGVIPNKSSRIDPPTNILAQTFNMPSQRAEYGLNSVALIHLPLSTADPPLERLCAYRI
jgi:hypothetical protein